MAVAAYREKAVTVCTIETLTHIRFKGVNVTNVKNVWRKCKYIDHVAFAKSTKRIDALYDFLSQSPEERSIFRQIYRGRVGFSSAQLCFLKQPIFQFVLLPTLSTFISEHQLIEQLLLFLHTLHLGHLKTDSNYSFFVF